MKRIVVCCDGTWDKPGNKDRGQLVETNVEKMYDAIETKNPLVRQVKYYGQGVGTSYSISDQLLGGGTGAGIDRNIQDAYKFLMWTYEPGDEIYFFGFSRGAYTVRSLAGFIRNCGILKPEFLHLVSEAYHLYRDRSGITHPDSDLMKAFKKSYGIEQETAIKFLGVWDTVGALGIPLSLFAWWNRKYQFHDVKLSSQIKFAYHALAVDEQRKSFAPTLWEVSTKQDAANTQVSEQVWFPGTHSNVGGGYVDSGLSNITLKWMIDKAKNGGLEFDEDYVKEIEFNSSGELRGTNTLAYKILGLFWRSVNNTSWVDRKAPPAASPSNRNERIHYTCMERLHKVKHYKPKNLPPALKNGTGFDPEKDSWMPGWVQYLISD